ncbi:hypothetical protein [Acinetobacter proteolyticus]|uniref:hypothetical protein n=1 Tax=Acinetobacter proteolyticus TaxID=1776741 RepID=UPI0031D7DD5F
MTIQDHHKSIPIKPIFVRLIAPEILLTQININNNEWIQYTDGWFYKVDKKDISLPFQRNFFLTNNLKKIEVSNINKRNLKNKDIKTVTPTTQQLKKIETMIRAILNLETSTPIENWSQDTEEKTLLEHMTASNHIKILSIE